MNTDGAGNDYLDIGNLRVSLVRGNNRTEANNWPGCDVIRIQAYREDRDNPESSNSLHRGAEFPVDNKDDIIDLIRVLLEMHLIK